MLSDIDIAQAVRPKEITDIARSLGIRSDELILHGNYIAKVSPKILKRLDKRPRGRLILVTCITPTKHGEGKTSTSIGLTQAFGRLNKRAVLCLREPSLGPMFGVKGGACGGGRSQVIPMEDINLHFTGDGYAVSAANNLLCAMLDNHIYFGNRLNIDPKNILIRRTIDMSDRTLRRIHFNINKNTGYESGFDIIAASEIMAILALSKHIEDLKARLSDIIIAFDKDKNPVTPKRLNAVGAMSALLANALMPNLVQTLEANPAFVHCGPFANIAHGANSIISTLTALKLADYVVTESGFGTDLGAEKFFDIVCRQAGIKADLAVVVVSQRAVSIHGLSNITKHIGIIRRFGVTPIVAINRFPDDSKKDLQIIKRHCSIIGVESHISEAVARGSSGATELARGCIELLKKRPSKFKFLYKDLCGIKEKIGLIAKDIYGADGVIYSKQAEADLRRIKGLGLERLPVNIAKTQFSISDNPKLKGVPTNWKLQVKALKICSGARFIVAVCGEIMLMPGLPKKPAAFRIDTDKDGKIKGLF